MELIEEKANKPPAPPKSPTPAASPEPQAPALPKVKDKTALEKKLVCILTSACVAWQGRTLQTS